MARTQRGKRIQERMVEIEPLLSQLARNGKIPKKEEKIVSLLQSVEKIETVLGESTTDIEKIKGQLLEALSEIQGDQPIINRHSPLSIPPAILDQFSDPVGDINLLMDPVKLTHPVTSRLLRGVSLDLIGQTRGLQPEVFGVYDFTSGGKVEPRIVVRWVVERTPRLKDLHGIYETTKMSYGQEIKGHKPSKGWEAVIRYRNEQGHLVSRKNGIYFGPDSYYSHYSCGVTITRRFKLQSEFQYLKQRFSEDWITRSIEGAPSKKFEVEIKEGGDNQIMQDEFVSLVVQLAYFLKQEALIDPRALAISVYRTLNRVGAEGAQNARPYGLKEVIETIERVLLLPLQQPGLAHHYQFQPESILLVGVPGTGKTLLAKFLMCQDYNAIFASVGSDKLLPDLVSSEGSKILLQIDKIGAATKLPVVLLVDDFEAVGGSVGKKERDPALISKLLNLLQGVREKGFFLIAATNYPEQVDPRLLEPGRLSKVVHVPLPKADDRVGILDLHVEGIPFKSEQEKASIIARMAQETSGWTGRYLAELALEAGRLCGLNLVGGDICASSNKTNRPLELTHFLEAKDLILRGANISALKRRDKEIQDFISQKGGEIGFGAKIE